MGSFGEDVDWSLRALRYGFSIQYVPTAIIYHMLGASFGRGGRQKAYLVEKNRIQAIFRSFPKRELGLLPFWTLQRLTIQGIGGLFGRGVAGFGGKDMISGAIKGNIAGMRSIPLALKKRAQDSRYWKCSDPEFRKQLHQQRPPVKDIWHPNLQTK